MQIVCAISFQQPLLPASTNGTRWCTGHDPAPGGAKRALQKTPDLLVVTLSVMGAYSWGTAHSPGWGYLSHNSSGVEISIILLCKLGHKWKGRCRIWGGQKGRELKFRGTQEVPIFRSVSIFNLHHPLFVSVWRNVDTTTVVDWSHWGWDRSTQGLHVALRRLPAWELSQELL